MNPDDLMFKPGAMKGERILVTGGGTGLGKVMAEALTMLGAEVYICGRRGGVLEAAAKEIMDAHGGKVTPVACDIRVPEAIHEMIETIWADGALTGLINNAAGNFISRTEDLSARGFDAIANIVFRGSFFVTLECGKRWIAEGRKGSVLSILTTWIWHGGPYTVPSAMSKAGLNVMTQSLAVEWAPKGIRFNAIAPGHRRILARQSAGPGRAHAGAGQPGRLPAPSRLGIRQRPDHRHRRRRLAGGRRRLLHLAQLDRRTVGTGALFDPRRQREGPRAADRLTPRTWLIGS
jgi:NAD(P)-dependent dehydrogenase (short-subunit alcohol dehydrogenase family)